MLHKLIALWAAVHSLHSIATQRINMSISTFNFQFYNYKLPVEVPQFTTAKSFSELEMDIDDEEQAQQELSTPAITSTPLPAVKQPPAMTTPRYTSEVSLAISAPDVSRAKPAEALRPQLRCPQKRWSMELREKVLEMSKRNNASDVADTTSNLQQRFVQQLADNSAAVAEAASETSHTVSDKINFFNRLTNTYESARNSNVNNNNNRFISLLRSTRPMGVATTSGGSAVGPVPPPKPKRLVANNTTTTTTTSVPHQFATPTGKAPSSSNNNTNSAQRKSSLRRKPSMEKSRATIARQNSSATLRPQRHAMMEDLSLVVPVRLRIAEYEQRISLNA